ncbi:MAG: hypothetical protein ACOX6V_02480 [Patescibacteria group bacterium]
MPKKVKRSNKSTKKSTIDHHKEVMRLAVLIILLSIGIIIGVSVTARNERILGAFAESEEYQDYIQYYQHTNE